MPTALSQAVALLAVGAIGMIALSATTAGTRLAADTGLAPLAAQTRPIAAPVHLRADVVERDGGPAVAAPARRRVEPARRTAPVAAASIHRASAPAKWLPSGTGMWIYQWDHSNGGRPTAVMKRAKVVGLTHLFVRTGSSHDGFTGAGVLRAVLPAASKAHLKVIAWDFPELDHPIADARRLAKAARFVVHGGARVSAVAPDIETPAEGTSSSPRAVRIYLKALRNALPANVAILATVPWPSSARVGHYPYATVAAHSDALLPMAYWYNNSPSAVTAASVKYLRRFHRPVMPVGQGYDGRLDVPYLPHNNLAKQVPAFFATAHRMGARAVSLWSWQSAPTATWRALKSASRLFPRR
ncbi:MAG: hypothetical protein QOG34_895 [Frankiaceae bacterium]|jgi:hypothetical protein|nr:hypothetical protein [Frankiaceae bacterium]